jgi:hypothetical protein
VDINLDITSQGGVDDGDYVRLYKIVDGGAEILVDGIKGKQRDVKTIKGTAQGKRLTLVIRAKVTSDDEIYSIDNLKVSYH